MFTRLGVPDVIEGSHLMDRASGYDSPIRIPAFVVQNGEVHRESIGADDPRAEVHFNSFLPALYAHLKEKGWLDRYIQHVLDEAHGADPPVTCDTWASSAGICPVCRPWMLSIRP